MSGKAKRTIKPLSSSRIESRNAKKFQGKPPVTIKPKKEA